MTEERGRITCAKRATLDRNRAPIIHDPFYIANTLIPTATPTLYNTPFYISIDSAYELVTSSRDFSEILYELLGVASNRSPN